MNFKYTDELKLELHQLCPGDLIIAHIYGDLSDISHQINTMELVIGIDEFHVMFLYILKNSIETGVYFFKYKNVPTIRKYVVLRP